MYITENTREINVRGFGLALFAFGRRRGTVGVGASHDRHFSTPRPTIAALGMPTHTAGSATGTHLDLGGLLQFVAKTQGQFPLQSNEHLASNFRTSL